MLSQIEDDGYAVRENILPDQRIDELIDALERIKTATDCTDAAAPSPCAISWVCQKSAN